MKDHNVLEKTSTVQKDICKRCQGLVVPSFTDSLFLEVAEAVQGPSWRCVNCGEWFDDTVLSNRLERHPAGSVSTDSPPQSRRRRWRR
ncbi:MAG: hypothetical protein IPM58_14280 [Nitrospira sp.]|nr:hypothetical protein [Nitrospira sp.]